MKTVRQPSPTPQLSKSSQDSPKPKHKADQRGQLLLFEFEEEKGGDEK